MRFEIRTWTDGKRDFPENPRRFETQHDAEAHASGAFIADARLTIVEVFDRAFGKVVKLYRR